MSFLISGRECYVDTADIKGWFLNTSSGTLSIEFELKPQSYGCAFYRLDLCIDENVVNAAECKKNITSPLVHSRRSVEILKHNTTEGRKVSPCGKVCFI
jgi:hypothetical protein